MKYVYFFLNAIIFGKIGGCRAMKCISITLAFLFSFVQTFAQNWTQADGIYGGEVTDIVSFGRYLVAASPLGGIYVSNDRGASWQNKVANTSVNRIFPVGKYLYARTASGPYYMSADSGNSWHFSTSFGYSDAFAVGDSIYSQSYYQRVCSADWGLTWHSTNIGISGWSFLFQFGRRIFAGGNGNGLKISLDNCSSWQNVASIPSTYMLQLIAVDSMLVLSDGQNLYRSVDSGITWQTVHQNAHFGKIVKHGNLLVKNTYDTVFISSDWGNSWRMSYITGSGIDRIVSHKQCLLVAKGDAIISSTDNGQSWQLADSLISTSYVCGITKCGGKMFAATGQQGVFVSSSNGFNWARDPIPNFPPDGQIISQYSDGDTLLESTWSLGLQISRDGGNTWHVYLDSLACLCSVKRGKFMCCSRMTPNNYYYSTVTSYDDGATWNRGDNGHPPFSTMVIKDSILFGAGFGLGFYRSGNFGLSWQMISNQHFFIKLFVDGNVIYGTDDHGGVWRSADDGISWAEILHSKSWNSRPGCDVVASNNRIWVAREPEGILYSRDSGVTWDSIGPGVTSVVKSICVIGNHIYAGTNRSLWIADLRIFTAGQSEVAPDDFFFSALPNPSPGVFQINYCTDNSRNVRLNILSSNGQLLSVQEFSMQKGELHQMIDLTALAKGIYFVELENGEALRAP